MNIVSFSGGKDSTAMLLMMLERGEKVDEIIFCDTGMEFQGMYEHINKVERHIGRKITHLKAGYSFAYYMFEYQTQKGKHTDRIGHGWPTATIRWCTSRLKTSIIDRYIRSKKSNNIKQYIGIAADEPNRIKGKNYPLAEWGVTEIQALNYCYSKGFDWDGLYKHFKRVSCWCCPLQNLQDLRNLRRYYPELWQWLRDMDRRSNNRFTYAWTVEQLEQRFAKEDEYIKNQMSLFG